MIKQYCKIFLLVILLKSSLSSNVQFFTEKIENGFVPFSNANSKKKVVFESSSFKYFLETNGLESYLVCKSNEEFEENGLLFVLEELPNKQGFHINYLPVGEGFSFNIFAAKMDKTEWLANMNTQTGQTPAPRNYALTEIDLNQAEWNEEDVKVGNENLFVPSLMKLHTDYSMEYFMDSDSQYAHASFDFSPNDPMLIDNAQFFATLENADIDIDEADGLYAKEMELCIDLYIKSLASYLESKGKSDIQEITNAMQKLNELKPKFNGVLKNAVASNQEVVQTGEMVYTGNMKIQEVTEVDNPDTEIYPEGADILLKRDGADFPVIKTKDIGNVFKTGSYYGQLFEENLTRFQNYFSESMGSEATLYFAAMHTHFVEGKKGNRITPVYNYLRMKELAVQYSGSELTKERFTDYLVKANAMLLKDIFMDMHLFWGKALYGSAFLTLIYKDQREEKVAIVSEINKLLKKHELLNEFKTKYNFDYKLLTFVFFSFGPFYYKLKHQILANTVELAGAFYEAKKDDPEMQEFWKSPTPSLLNNTMFIYSLSKHDFVEVNLRKTTSHDKFLKIIKDSKSGQKYII